MEFAECNVSVFFKLWFIPTLIRVYYAFNRSEKVADHRTDGSRNFFLPLEKRKEEGKDERKIDKKRKAKQEKLMLHEDSKVSLY